NLARGKARVAGINITQALIVPSLLVLVASAAMMIFDDTVLNCLGTPDSLRELAREYLLYFVPFFLPLALFDIVMFAVRLDGAPNFSMYSNILAAGLNIVLDYLFIFVFDWGLAGAATATGIGYAVGAAVMLWYMLRRSRTLKLAPLKLSPHSLQLTARNIGYMAYVGFPALLSELALACMMIVGNLTFIRYVGKDGVAAYSIACYLFPIIFMIYSGIIQSAQPIISYNYGAGQHARVVRTFRLATVTAVCFGAVICAITWWGSEWITGLFLTSDAPAYLYAEQGLRWFSLGYVFFGINVVVIGYLQSLEQGKIASLLTALRGIVLMSLCFVVLPRLWGERGIWLAVPVAECATTLLIVSVYLMRRLITKR
ncbi:MAG: MATE family efflux transporter, partial [Alistipes sp.]